MAPSSKLHLVLFLSSIFLHAALAELVCEDLPKDVCAFSIASSGKRCLLETSVAGDGSVEYQCRTSEVVVERMAEYIETDQCVKACGVDRNSVGISSDALLEPQFTAKLCSPACYQKCPNIVDLYFNLAAGEGVFLPDLCERQRSSPHRAMSELLSSGVAPGPVSGNPSVTYSHATAPASAPTYAYATAPASAPI
ncbi:PAR1 protein [Fagus crenata]